MKEVSYIQRNPMAPKDAWDSLSIADKAAMMRVAVQNGITNLDDIRAKYNEFAEGGDENNLTPWKALGNIDYITIPDTTFTREKTGAGSIEVMFKDTPKEGYEYGTGYKYPHPMPGHNVVIYNPKENDAQDIRLDALHIMPQDATYDALRSELEYYADGSDIANNAKDRMEEDIAKYGHTVSGSYQDYYNNEIDGFLRNMFIEGTPEYIKTKRYYPNKKQLKEWNKEIMPYVDRIHNYLITGNKPANVFPEITVTGKKKSLGGNLYAGAPTDNDLIDFLIKEEGFITHPKDIGDGKITLGSGLTAKKWHDLYKKRGNKWSAEDNRRAVAEEVANRRRWAENNIPNWDSLPSSSQKALLAYKYNYDFTKENSPKLFKALSDSNLYEAAKQMDATSKDPKFKKGLADRRRREQNWFLSDVDMPKMAAIDTPSIVEPELPVSTAVVNPFIIPAENTTFFPQVTPVEDNYVEVQEITPEQRRAEQVRNTFDAINNYNRMMDMLSVPNNPQPMYVPKNAPYVVRGLGGPIVEAAMNEYKKGGGIHIKHPGRLTALKKRTGKTEAELYNDGNPAHKKMVVFARNSRKWKHGDGGTIYNGGELPEVEVVGYRPIELKTYYPLGKNYPWTGHSQLNIPITTDAADEYGLYGLQATPEDKKWQAWVIVDKKMRDKGYNLLTNNCADATLNYLNAAFETQESPMLFTTPGDVRDYAINTLGGKEVKDMNGIDTILIPRNKDNADIISRKVLDLLNNSGRQDKEYTGSHITMRTKYTPKWKHGDGGNLYGGGGQYDIPQTFAGRVAQVIGAQPSTSRGMDIFSSALQLTPFGHYVAALDLGRDLNRAVHKEEGAKKDSAIDILSMIPGINAPGLKAADNLFNTLRANKKLRNIVNTTGITGKVADFIDDTWGANKTSKALGGNLFSGEEEGSQQMITTHKPYYDRDGILLYNRTLPETVIIPDSQLSPAERNYRERQRQRNLPDYAQHKDREITSRQVANAQKEWENSFEKQALDYGQAIASGIGMGADMVSRLPIYSSLKGASTLSRAETPMDYIESGLWLAPLAGTVGKAAYAAAKPLVSEAANMAMETAAKGKRFVLDVGDRYQGMKDAAAYRSANGNMDARTIANMKWWENGGTPTGINRAGVSNYGDFRTYYLYNPENPLEGHYSSPIVEGGGNMTLTTHLGGATPGDITQEILPMGKSEMAALSKYLRGVPDNTYLGEVGKTKNYAEQYFNVKPSRIKAFKDAVHNKKEINEPYWNEKEHIEDFMDEENPIEKAFFKHLYEANEPLSADSYKLVLQEAAKDNGRFALRYDSSPMGMFNPQGVYENEFYNSLQSLAPREQVNAINTWMRSYYPKARPSYLKNGKVMIPRPLLMIKGKQ